MVVEAAEVCTFNAASSTSNPPCHEGENQDCRGHTYCPHREGEEKATARRAVGLSTQTGPRLYGGHDSQRRRFEVGAGVAWNSGLVIFIALNNSINLLKTHSTVLLKLFRQQEWDIASQILTDLNSSCNHNWEFPRRLSPPTLERKTFIDPDLLCSFSVPPRDSPIFTIVSSQCGISATDKESFVISVIWLMCAMSLVALSWGPRYRNRDDHKLLEFIWDFCLNSH